MPGFMENISTLNSFVRTLLAVIVLGGVGGGGWYAYYKYNAKEFEAQEKATKLAEATKKLEDAEADIAAKAKLIQEKDTKISTLNKDIEKLRTRMALLKVDHRLARLTVVNQEKRGEKGDLYTTVEFVELNDEGAPYTTDPARVFDIKGDLVYIDSWVVKFDDKYIEEKDLDIRVENNTLTVKGERKFEKEEKDKKYHRIERSYGNFLRSFTLPDAADGAKVNAEFKEGVLKVHLPKSEKAKPKTVEVKVS